MSRASYPIPAAILVSLGACISVGAGARGSLALTDSPIRRVGGHVDIGTFTEFAEDRLVGQLFFTRDIGPLGGISEGLGGWGARLMTLPRGRLPGLFASGVYAQNDDETQPRALAMIATAGVSFARIRPATRGRGFGAITLGLVAHRQRQDTVDGGALGYFIGLELGVVAGFDLLGPLYARESSFD